MLCKEQSIIGRLWALVMVIMVIIKEGGGDNREEGSLRPGQKGPYRAS